MKPILILTAFFILSCNAEKQFAKKEKHAKEFYQTHPELLAGFCDDEFPVPEVEYIPGDTIIKYESIIHPGVYLPCPEPTLDDPKPVIKCPESKEITKYISKTDTLKVTDSRQIFIYQNELKRVNQINETLAMENNILKDELRAAKNARNNWMWAFIVLGIINLAFIAFKVFK